MNDELVYDPKATIVLVKNPYTPELDRYQKTAEEIVWDTKHTMAKVNLFTSRYNIIKQFLEEKFNSEGDDASADFDELVELAKELDVEVTKSVNIRVDAQFEIDVDIPVWEDARDWADNHLEFDLVSDGSITYVSIQDVEEM